jgi:hopanoid-associated phosphorylase
MKFALQGEGVAASMARNSSNHSLATAFPETRAMPCPMPAAPSGIADPALSAGLGATLVPPDRFVIALVGLAFEARIASGPGVVVICRSRESDVAVSLGNAVKKGCRSIISFGVAGGLAPHLVPGDWIVASSVIDAQHTHPTDKVWSEKVLKTIAGATHAPIVGADAAVAHPDDKRRMHAETGAAVVDMESHLVARFASAHGLSFVAVRVVIDPAHRVVPGAALSGMRPDGGTSVTAVILDLIARPSQLPDLLRVTVDAYAARRALLRASRMLGPCFGLSPRAVSGSVHSVS